MILLLAAVVFCPFINVVRPIELMPPVVVKPIIPVLFLLTCSEFDLSRALEVTLAIFFFFFSESVTLKYCFCNGIELYCSPYEGEVNFDPASFDDLAFSNKVLTIIEFFGVAFWLFA